MARYFLAYFTLTSCLVAGQSPKYGLNGRNVSLVPEITEQPNSILWKHNGNKVVEFNGREQEEYSSHKNRITLDWHSAELMIANLRFEDSGDYDLERDVNKELRRSHFKLEVMGTEEEKPTKAILKQQRLGIGINDNNNVAKPTISCKMNDDAVSGELMCSAEPRRPESLMTFEWNSLGTVQPGPKLTISLGEKHDAEVHSCWVSNPVSKEMATFTAKDCYRADSSSGALIACLVISMLVLLIAAIVAIVFCKRHHKACFAGDLENPTTGGSDEKTESEEHPFLVKKASTPPSTQPLRLTQGLVQKRTQQFEQINDGKVQRGLVQKRTQQFEQINDGKVQRESDPDEDGEAKSPPANGFSPPTAQPHSLLTRSSPNMAPKDTAGEHKEDANSDQVTGETSDDNVREADSSGIGKSNESDDSNKDTQSLIVPEQNGSETSRDDQDLNLYQGETHTGDDNQQELDKPVSAVEDEPEENDKNQNLATPLLHQCPSPTTPDHRNTNTFQETPDTAHPDPDREEDDKTRQEPEGQSDSSTAGAETSKVTYYEKIERTKNSSTKKNPGSDKAADEDEEAQDEKSAPASAETSPTAQPRSPLTKSSPNTPPEDTGGDHKEEPESEQAPGGTDSSGITQKRNESDDSTVEVQSSTVPEEPTSLPESPSPTTPDNNNTKPIQGTPDTAHADPDQEEGSDEKTESEEHPFLVEKASTPPPTQPLRVTQGLVQKRRQQFEPGKVQRESDSDEDEEAKSPPANGFSPPTAQPHSLLTRSSPNMAPKDTAGEHKEDANSDQVTGETSDDNFREADSSGIGKSNESDDSNKDTQSLIVPEQNGSETSRDDQDLNLYQGETHTGDDNQQELDKPVSAVEDEPEENDKNQNLATPLLHQCPSPTTPDNRNTNTFQETPDTAHPDPDQEEGGKTSQGSEGQSDSSTAEADKSEGETAENEEQCDPKEEKKEEH